MLPGVAVVFGEVPAELKPDLIDFGLVSAADRKQISTVLGSIGNTATVTGNLGNAFASVQGLYRISDATQALLKAGGTLEPYLRILRWFLEDGETLRVLGFPD